MKRRISLLLVILLLLSGCTEAETPYIPTGDALVQGSSPTETQQTVTEKPPALVYYPDRSLNPYQCTDYTNRVLFPLLYQGLFAVDRDYRVSPILCKRYTCSGDMRTYSFFVEDATFSDGTAVTATDVAASLNAAKNGAYYKGRFQHVTSISVAEEGVVVKLDTPYENFPLLLDIPIVKASEVAATQPLGTGPYFLDDSTQGKWLRRRQNWWCKGDAPITAAFITLVTAESASQIRDQFEYNNVSLVCTNAAAAEYADFHGDYELWDCESGTFLYLVCSNQGTLLKKPELRAVLTHAINRDALVESFYRGFARTATLPASPQSPWYATKLAEKYGYNRQLFLDALEAVPEAERKVTLLVNSSDAQRLRIARAIAEQLKQCGLTVTLQEKTGSAFTDTLRWGKYDLYLAQTKLSANMDLTAFFTKSGSLSYGGLADAATYAMCLEALANDGNYYKLHKMIMDKGQLCPLLFHSYAVYGARGAVSTLTPARDNLFFYSIGKTMDSVYFRE